MYFHLSVTDLSTTKEIFQGSIILDDFRKFVLVLFLYCYTAGPRI